MTIALVIVAGLVAGLVAAVVWLRRRYLVVTVDGPSMRPTVDTGDRVLVRRGNRVRAGQVVLLVNPRQLDPPPDLRLDPDAVAAFRACQPRWLVKRVVAVSGDEVPVALRAAPGADAPVDLGQRVPAGHITVLGDNPGASQDSRHIGHVPVDHVLGVVRRRVAAASTSRSSGSRAATVR